MTFSCLFITFYLIATGFSKQRRKCKLTYEEFRNSHNWNQYYNKTRQFFFDNIDAAVPQLKSSEFGKQTRGRRKDYDFPYKIPNPEYKLLSPNGFRIAIKDTGFIKWIQANVKYDEQFNVPYDICVPAPLIADLQMKNGSWIYENTEYVHRDSRRVHIWFLVSTVEDLVYREMGHFFEIIEYIDGEMDLNWYC